MLLLNKAFMLLWARKFSITGRSTIEEYWFFIVALFAVYSISFLALLLYCILTPGLLDSHRWVYTILGLFCVFFYTTPFFICVLIRRLHDIGLPTWFVIVLFMVSMVLPKTLFPMLFTVGIIPGRSKTTRYGASPRENLKAYYEYYIKAVKFPVQKSVQPKLVELPTSNRPSEG